MTRIILCLTFASLTATVDAAPVKLRKPELPGAVDPALSNPIDRFLADRVDPSMIVDDHAFARRAYLDLIGLLPTPEQLDTFSASPDPEKRSKLIDTLLMDRRAYAEHWYSFWADALRNAYRGTGFIDNGRVQITEWLFRSLYENKPYDRFVHELISPVPGSDGFIRGIIWRGVVNESQRREIQAAQNVAQVFLGTNLKCASCHDSFINHWKLKDAYALASVFSAEPLVMHRCDKPIGEVSSVGFLFPELGSIDAHASTKDRMARLADLVTKRENGRFTRTIVNRLWAELMGGGIIETVDDLDGDPFHAELLDYLAWDFVEHDYDLKHTLNLVATSKAYQMASVSQEEGDFVFRGPLVKRMSAEQFVDAVRTLAGVWPTATGPGLKIDGRKQGGQLAEIAKVLGTDVKTAFADRPIRAALTDRDELQASLGRPNREQVVTIRESNATMLQSLELTNGESLDTTLRKGADHWLRETQSKPDVLIEKIYRTAVGRDPNDEERRLASELIGQAPSRESVADLLWIVVMLPEFQLIR